LFSLFKHSLHLTAAKDISSALSGVTNKQQHFKMEFSTASDLYANGKLILGWWDLKLY